MRRAKGFTLLELLIAVSIITVLMGLVLLGMSHIRNSMREKSTHVALESGRAMLTELDAAMGSKGLSQRQPAFMWYPTGNVYSTAGFNIWKTADPTAPLASQPVSAIAPNADVSKSNFGRYAFDPIRNTVVVMSVLMALPANRAMQAKIPANQLATVTKLPTDPFYDSKWTSAPATFDPARYPIMLDAWGNPIIFVPSSGLTGVNLNYKGGNLDPSLPTSYDRPNQTIVAPDGRPFFASAGGDGDFSKGDDNVYSFEN